MSQRHIDACFKALKAKGFPDEFCQMIAENYMNTEYTSKRMCAYLYSVKNPSVEEIADEMFAIISDRDRYRDKHLSEHANATVTAIYNGLLNEDK